MQLLKGKKILIAGGTGEVGEGIVKVLLHNGASVVVPSRSKEKLYKLRTDLGNPGNLYTPHANIRSLAGATELLSWIKIELGQIDSVIASIGEWWQGAPLLDISLDTWHKLLDNSLTVHFILAKVFLPYLAKRKESSYIFVNGAGGLNAVPHAGPFSISAAGEIMLKDVLCAENDENCTRINTLLLDTPILTTPMGNASAEWITAEEAGKYCAYLISPLSKTVNGKTIIFNHPRQLDTVLEESKALIFS